MANEVFNADINANPRGKKFNVNGHLHVYNNFLYKNVRAVAIDRALTI